MKIIIAGGNGFLGRALQKHFEAQQHTVVILTRHPSQPSDVYWDAANLGKWTETLNGAAVLINLVGKSVDCRYNDKNKAEILQSRIASTVVLGKAMLQVNHPPTVWLNASSATIYIHAETQQMDETTGIIGDDFSMNICKQWEQAFYKQVIPNCRKVALRTSIVLGNSGGAFPKMKRIAKLGLGGQQGRGNQLVSYIWLTDFCKAVDFIIAHTHLDGAVNVTGPTPLTNKEFMKKHLFKYNSVLHLNSPVWLLELASMLMQTETELLLKSRNVVPKKLLDAGFIFEGDY
jgi:uncharacterized protein